MDYPGLINSVNAKCKGEYAKIRCHFLKDGKCSIYDKRPNCCRNFPQKNGFCSKSKCILPVSSKHSLSTCSKCKENCCEYVLVPKNIKITKIFLMKWMNMDCKTCRKFF